MSAPDPVGVSSQDARVEFEAGAKPEDMARGINAALLLIRDDILRLAQQVLGPATTTHGSGNHRWTASGAGIADVWAVSDTASTGSSGANYHTLSLFRNGAAANTVTYDTRRTEVDSYKGGNYLGQTTVSVGDMLVVNIATTGVPTALTTANFSLVCKLRES